MNYVNSRGEDEEQLRVIQNLLHVETHLADALVADPDHTQQIANLQDKVRKTRQNMVRLWSGNNINPNYWCSVKHNLETQRHLEECIENSKRKGNNSEVENLAYILRNVKDEGMALINEFKSGRPTNGDICFRCEEDIDKIKQNLGTLNKNNGNSNKRVLNIASQINNVVEKNNTKKGEKEMKDTDGLIIVGGAVVGGLAGDQIGKFLDDGRTEVPSPDTLWGKPSFLLNAIGGLGLTLGAIYGLDDKNAEVRLGLVGAGSGMLVNAVNPLVRELITPETGGASLRARAPIARAPVARAPVARAPVARAPSMSVNGNGNGRKDITYI